jgi:hypothetical protein
MVSCAIPGKVQRVFRTQFLIGVLHVSLSVEMNWTSRDDPGGLPIMQNGCAKPVGSLCSELPFTFTSCRLHMQKLDNCKWTFA